MIGVRTWLAALWPRPRRDRVRRRPGTGPARGDRRGGIDHPPTSLPRPPVPGPTPPTSVASVEDLASRLGVDAGDVEVVAVQEVTWSDGSRGCAKKGMNYTQSLIDGCRITLEVDGTTYEYHSGGSGGPFLCERPTQ